MFLRKEFVPFLIMETELLCSPFGDLMAPASIKFVGSWCFLSRSKYSQGVPKTHLQHISDFDSDDEC